MRDLNYQFLENNKNGIKINNKSFIYKKGKLPILISAPHAVKQVRESEIKPSDYLTGALAINLANKCNCSYFVRICNDNDDPNFPIGETLNYIDNEYLKGLKEFVEDFDQFLVIDLHGCKDTKLADCSLWTEQCNMNIVKIFEKNFHERNLSFDNGSEYLGGQVTRQCSLITNAFQLEVKRKIRNLKLENYYLLKSFIDSMEKSIYETYNYCIELQKKL